MNSQKAKKYIYVARNRGEAMHAGRLAMRCPGDYSTAEPVGGTIVHPPCSFLLAPGVQLNHDSSFNSSPEPKNYAESKIHYLEAQ